MSAFKSIYLVPLGSRNRGFKDNLKTLKMLCHAVRDRRRLSLFFFQTFLVFGSSQGEKSGLITSRHILMCLHCAQSTASPPLSLYSSSKKRAAKPSKPSKRERERGEGAAVDGELEIEKRSPAGGGECNSERNGPSLNPGRFPLAPRSLRCIRCVGPRRRQRRPRSPEV